jgi:hypothetical protein
MSDIHETPKVPDTVRCAVCGKTPSPECTEIIAAQYVCIGQGEKHRACYNKASETIHFHKDGVPGYPWDLHSLRIVELAPPQPETGIYAVTWTKTITLNIKAPSQDALEQFIRNQGTYSLGPDVDDDDFDSEWESSFGKPCETEADMHIDEDGEVYEPRTAQAPPQTDFASDDPRQLLIADAAEAGGLSAATGEVL